MMKHPILHGELVNNTGPLGGSWPSRAHGKSIEGGIVTYEEETDTQGKVVRPAITYLLPREAIIKMRASAVGRPLVGRSNNYEHATGITADKAAKEKYDGIVFQGTDDGDGWDGIDFLITDPDTKEKCAEGYQLSAAYLPTETDDTPGKWHGEAYDAVILNGEYTHWLVTPTPRYQGATIELMNSLGGKVKSTIKSLLKALLPVGQLKELVNSMEEDERKAAAVKAKKDAAKLELTNALLNAKTDAEKATAQAVFEAANAAADAPGAADQADAAGAADQARMNASEDQWKDKADYGDDGGCKKCGFGAPGTGHATGYHKDDCETLGKERRKFSGENESFGPTTPKYNALKAARAEKVNALRNAADAVEKATGDKDKAEPFRKEADTLEKLPLGGGDVVPDPGVAQAGTGTGAGETPEAKAEREKREAGEKKNASDGDLAAMWAAAFEGPDCDDDFLQSLGISDKATADLQKGGCKPYAQQPADVKAIWKESYEDVHGENAAEKTNSLKAQAKTAKAAKAEKIIAEAWNSFKPDMLEDAVVAKVAVAGDKAAPLASQPAEVQAAWKAAVAGATGKTVAELCNSLAAKAKANVELRNAVKAKDKERVERFNALRQAAAERGGLTGMPALGGDSMEDKANLGAELYG